MKLATLRAGGPDGRLVVVSRDLTRCVTAHGVAPTLLDALERWDEAEPGLRRLSDALAAGPMPGERPFDPASAAAPLPRTWQWLDGSVFKSHAELTTKAFQLANTWSDERPLMYQGMSHQFLSATDDAPFPSEDDGIDFEGEFGVITDAVPFGCSAEDASQHIRLLVQINDWSLRAIGREEMAKGFGWVRAKPACSLAPVAITPDELGDAWTDCRVGLDLHVTWNGRRFGHASGAQMAFGFHDLIAHAAYSRSLPAGTVIGSGTVSNADWAQVGSSCIVERRGIEIIEAGEPRTNFLRFGDHVQMEAIARDGSAPFGRLAQLVVSAERHRLSHLGRS